MTNTNHNPKPSLDPAKGMVLNMPTRYKWEGANNSFARGEMEYAPNEVACLAIPDVMRKVYPSNYTWTAPFLVNGSRVRVVMGKRDGTFRVFPLDATLQHREWMANWALADIAAGIERKVAYYNHCIKGIELPAAYLAKLPPEQAYDDLYQETQRQIAVAGEGGSVERNALRYDFHKVLMDVMLAMDAQCDANGTSLTGLLRSRESIRFLEEARAALGAKSGVAKRQRAPAERRKLLGKPVYTMLGVDSQGAGFERGMNITISSDESPMKGCSYDMRSFNLPDDEAMQEVLENMRDKGLVPMEAFLYEGCYRMYDSQGAMMILGTAMTTVARLAAIYADKPKWEAFYAKWRAEADLRDPDFSDAELFKLMNWPDLSLMAGIDMTITREVTR